MTTAKSNPMKAQQPHEGGWKSMTWRSDPTRWEEAATVPTAAERAMLSALCGGCLAPVGAWGRVENDLLSLDGVVLSGNGQERLAASASGSAENSEEIGRQVAEKLLALGAAALISAARMA